MICTTRFNDDDRIPFSCNWEDCLKNYCAQCILDDFQKSEGKFNCPGHCVHHAMNSELSLEFMKENDNICGDNWVVKNNELLEYVRNHPEIETTEEKGRKMKLAFGAALKKMVAK